MSRHAHAVDKQLYKQRGSRVAHERNSSLLGENFRGNVWRAATIEPPSPRFRKTSAPTRQALVSLQMFKCSALEYCFVIMGPIVLKYRVKKSTSMYANETWCILLVAVMQTTLDYFTAFLVLFAKFLPLSAFQSSPVSKNCMQKIQMLTR